MMDIATLKPVLEFLSALLALFLAIGALFRSIERDQMKRGLLD